MKKKAATGETGVTGNGSPFIFSLLLDGCGGATSLDEAATAAWRPEDGFLWVHLDISRSKSCQWLEADSRLPKSAQDLLLALETRPRSLAQDEGLLIALRGVNTNPDENPEDMVAVRIWIDANRIVSTRRRRLLSVSDVAGALGNGAGPRTGGEVLQEVVERLADRIGDFVDSLEARLDDDEDECRTGDPNAFLPRLSALRRQIASVRRFLAPQREALDRLARHSTSLLSEVVMQDLHQEADRITRYLEDLDLARERAVVLHEELLSRIAQEQNARMYVLSVVAAIFLPLSFLTGLLGMNVGGLPGVDSPVGFTGSIVLMVVVAVILVVFFRHKKWL